MKFFRVYIEITNNCGLNCDFCPPKSRKTKIMDLNLFEKILKELEGKTKEIAFHIMGDPLLNKNLKLYLNLAHSYSHKISLTTSGFYIAWHEKSTLTHEAISQLNISLNSFNKNSSKIDFNTYMKNIFLLIDYKLLHNEKEFINLRLWNLNDENGKSKFNEIVFKTLEEKYKIKIENDYAQKESFRIAKKVRVHFDKIFAWPNLSNDTIQDSPCYGLNRQLGILADGTVVPCCFDYEARAALGNLFSNTLYDIVSSAKHIAKGLKDGKPTEELCKRCSYRLRFLKRI